MPRVVVIGLDCFSPDLVYGVFSSHLPHLGRLAQQGCSAYLESCIPPITIPAWPVMMTGVDPGTLGVYGFRVKKSHQYDDEALVSSMDFQYPMLWQLLSRHGLRSRVIGVPATYPVKPLHGCLVSGMLTPDCAQDFAYPAEIVENIHAQVPSYRFDIPSFRKQARDEIAAQIWQMTEQRFCLAEHWLKQTDWDFFMMVEMGPDRLHHVFWDYDSRWQRLDSANESNILLAYYQFLDKKIGCLLSHLTSEDIVCLVSDHGAQANQGHFALNQWLLENGWLKLKSNVLHKKLEPLKKEKIDWRLTRAWAQGGYCGRIFLNVQGREPDGIIKSQDIASTLSELTEQLKTIPGPKGKSIHFHALRPCDIYRQSNGFPPDLLLCVEDYAFRVIGSLGHDSFWVKDNDQGHDQANHARFGFLILLDRRKAPLGTRLAVQSIYNIAPTLLHYLQVPIPSYMHGRLIHG